METINEDFEVLEKLAEVKYRLRERLCYVERDAIKNKEFRIWKITNQIEAIECYEVMRVTTREEVIKVCNQII